MPVVVGIRFKDSGKTYFFDPRELELPVGDHVIVETVRGPELAKVAYPRHEVPESEVVSELKPVLRRAEQSDFDRLVLLQQRHDEVLERCAEKIALHSLPMKLVKAEYSFDGSRLTFFFTSEKRVDFRLLVRDLARTFKSRIELRQIGPRDEAKLLGGIGPCGRLLCCATFLPDYARVSIKMAKDQDLPLNPAKISGVCGRLLCCLSYEHEQYLQIKTTLPSKGSWVQTPEGPGEVISVNVLKETVFVSIPGIQVPVECTPSQIQEATSKVGEVARARVEEGIAPVKVEHQRKDRGERRLLRDELDHNDVLDALALLEEGDQHVSDDTSRQRGDNEGQRRAEAGQGRRSFPKEGPQIGPPTDQRRSPAADQRSPRPDGTAGRSDRAASRSMPPDRRPRHSGELEEGFGQPGPRDDTRPKGPATQPEGESQAFKGARPPRTDDRSQGPLRRGGFELAREKLPPPPTVPTPPETTDEPAGELSTDEHGRVRRRKQRGDRR